MKRGTKSILKFNPSISNAAEFVTVEFRPVNSDKSFLVKIPKSIRDAAHNLTLDGAKDIRDSVMAACSKVAVPKDRGLVEVCETLLRITRWNLPEILPKEKTGLTGLSLELAKKGLLGVPHAKEDALWYSQFSVCRNLNSTITKRLLTNAVREAIFDNDIGFFIKLGRRLSEPPKTTVPPFKVNRLRNLILWHWIDPHGVGVAFCHFTDDALVDFLTIVAPFVAVTLDSVRKTRTRLELKQGRRLIKNIERRGGVLLLS